MYYLIAIVVIIQLLYMRSTDVPFYYKEIMYDWNYITTQNIKFNNKAKWIQTKIKKGYYIDNEIHEKCDTNIQTDLFSQQQQFAVHGIMNSILIVCAIVVFMYMLYTYINTILYKHEKNKIIKSVILLIITITATLYIYNTELLTSILYKTHFSYTDAIYKNDEMETASYEIVIVILILIWLYLNKLYKKEQRTISKLYIYSMILILNIIKENTIIGMEYVYLFIYVEVIIILTHILIILKKK